MDESQNHNDEQNKLNTKDELLYNSIYIKFSKR